jgi:hypothetical protein
VISSITDAGYDPPTEMAATVRDQVLFSTAGAVYYSEDSGLTWTRGTDTFVGAIAGQIHQRSVKLSGASGYTLILGTNSGSGANLWRSDA